MYSRLPKLFGVTAGMPFCFGFAAFWAKINALLIHIVRAYQAASDLEGSCVGEKSFFCFEKSFRRSGRETTPDLTRAQFQTYIVEAALPHFQPFRRFFAITRRCISLVPSPMVKSFESRQYFSAG